MDRTGGSGAASPGSLVDRCDRLVSMVEDGDDAALEELAGARCCADRVERWQRVTLKLLDFSMLLLMTLLMYRWLLFLMSIALLVGAACAFVAVLVFNRRANAHITRVVGILDAREGRRETGLTEGEVENE